MQKLIDPVTVQDASNSHGEVIPVMDDMSNVEPLSTCTFSDYSNLFGEDFQMPDQHWDFSHLSILDVRAVEEGMLHILYASASQVTCNNVTNYKTPGSLLYFLSMQLCIM